MMILGIEDPWIWGVYLGIILSTLLCVVISHIVRSITFYIFF